MAAAFTWPGSLPQRMNRDYSESGGVVMISSPTDTGPGKLRRRGNASNRLRCSCDMTKAQIATFEDFVKNTIKGTARFNFSHPRTELSIEVRFQPVSEGQLYTMSYIAPDLYQISFSLEVMP